MPPDSDADLNALIAKCECAIRRGDVPYLETLHTLQQRLVAARDAHRRTRTEAELRAAIALYDQHVPATTRETTLDELTAALDQARTQLAEQPGADGTDPIDDAV